MSALLERPRPVPVSNVSPAPRRPIIVTDQPYPWAVISPAQVEAAAGFGKLVAMGLLTWESCIPGLLEAAQANGYRGDERGARTKLAGLVRDSARHWERVRGDADRAIRKRVAPLLAQRAPGRAILQTAWAECERWDRPLSWYDVQEVCREEAAWWTRWHGQAVAHG